MLFLQFSLGAERYLVAASLVREVLPLLALKALPRSLPGVAGLADWRGQVVPVIDLCQIALGRPAAFTLATRIAVVDYPDARATLRPLGLIAESLTNTLRREPSQFEPANIANPDAPYLGPVTRDAQGLLQWVEPAQLLTPEIRAQLFPLDAEAV